MPHREPALFRLFFLCALPIVLLAACEGDIGSGSLLTDDDGGPSGASDGLLSSGDGGSSRDTEPCNGLDDDGDAEVDEGCSCTAKATQACFPGPASKLKGLCAKGTQTCFGDTEFGVWGKCEGAIAPTKELCGNGLDEDCDGQDLPCPKPDAGPPAADATPKACAPGATQSCYTGPAGTLGKGICKSGSQTCQPNGQWGGCVGSGIPIKEACGNGIDEDCDGQDLPCPGQVVTVPVSINGDCVTASCPSANPYPVGCNIKLDGGDNRGCVASTPTSSVVYFQEGDKCGKGKVQGVLYCSTKPGSPLNAQSCNINKSVKYYPTTKSGCPATS